MASTNGIPLAALTSQSGNSGARAYPAGRAFTAVPPQATTYKLKAFPTQQNQGGNQTFKGGVVPKAPSTSIPGIPIRYAGDCWFDRVIVKPRRIDLGLVLSTKLVTIDIFNSHRNLSRVWQTYVNMAGAGISITDLPALPKTLLRLGGSVHTLQVLADGPPTISGTEDFGFDLAFMAKIPITGQRAIVFPFEPEAPIREELEWATDVILKRSGKEQRRSLRHTPRQHFEFAVLVDGFDRRSLDSILFDVQHRAFGLPVWHEAGVSTAAVGIGATSVAVQSTSFRDFRVGGLVLLLDTTSNFEAFEVASPIGGTTINLVSPTTKAFPVGIRVLPVVSAFLEEVVPQRRYRQDLQEVRFRFAVTDNLLSIADGSAFPTFNSKVLLDEPNLVEADALSESSTRSILVIDAVTGTLIQYSDEVNSRRVSRKGFVATSLQRLWQVRQLLHLLKGRATSFYLPTFYPELSPVAAITSGGTTLTVTNVGYAKFVKARQPRNVVQVVLNSGVKLIRTVNSATEIDPLTEQLVVSSAWGVDAQVSEILRVEFVEKVRLDSDRVELVHSTGTGQSTIHAPIKAVLD